MRRRRLARFYKLHLKVDEFIRTVFTFEDEGELRDVK